MNVKTALNIPASMSWEEKYNTIINALGKENVEKCIPFTMDHLIEMYKKDKNFNIHKDVWDRAAGFLFQYNPKTKTKDVKIINSCLISLMKKKLNVTVFSCAENVCILKKCAKNMIQEVEQEESK